MSGRATKLSPQDFTLLDQWGRLLDEAFGETPYLVGSVLGGEGTFRDVDVRMWAPTNDLLEPPFRLRAINLGITLWGRMVTGLPIDFQFQSVEEFREHDGQPRNPLGIRSDLGWER